MSSINCRQKQFSSLTDSDFLIWIFFLSPSTAFNSSYSSSNKKNWWCILDILSNFLDFVFSFLNWLDFIICTSPWSYIRCPCCKYQSIIFYSFTSSFRKLNFYSVCLAINPEQETLLKLNSLRLETFYRFDKWNWKLIIETRISDKFETCR